MYKKILVTLDATPTDRAIVEHISKLALECQSHLVLLHVAEGWAAQIFGRDAVSPEVTSDQAYLERLRGELEAKGLSVEAKLAYGDPVTEIVRWIEDEKCDLVAMSTHGHRFLGDLLFGTTAIRVQHRVRVPVLLLKAG